jgi:hypothetical protein
MKLWILAGLTMLASASSAFANEIVDDSACRADTTAQEARGDVPGGATSVQTPSTQRRAVAPPQRDANAAPVHADTARRRSGKPIPDAELIAPRGAL